VTGGGEVRAAGRGRNQPEGRDNGRMGRRGLVLLMVLAAGVGVVPAGPSGAEPPAATFGLFPTGAHGSEVNVGFTRSGVMFFGGWDHIARSTDDGRTWAAASPPTPLAADRVLIVDRATGRVFVDDTTLACTVLSWSDDLGQTWTTDPLACGGGATDHPKVAVGPRTVLADPTGKLYPNVVYLCANSLTHTPCTVSVDGGATFGPALPAGFAEPDKGRVTPTCAFQGVPIAAADGTVYQPRGQCGAFVDRSTDNGLTWERHVVAQGEGATSGDTPDLAVAPDGTVWFFWTGADWQPRLARSTDGGRSWSAPISVVAATDSASKSKDRTRAPRRCAASENNPLPQPTSRNVRPDRSLAPSGPVSEPIAAAMRGSSTSSMNSRQLRPNAKRSPVLISA